MKKVIWYKTCILWTPGAKNLNPTKTEALEKQKIGPFVNFLSRFENSKMVIPLKPGLRFFKVVKPY